MFIFIAIASSVAVWTRTAALQQAMNGNGVAVEQALSASHASMWLLFCVRVFAAPAVLLNLRMYVPALLLVFKR